jgi:E3 ubiquitin-protein ligase UBR1
VIHLVEVLILECKLTRTCGLDETCVLCQYCFNPDDHRDHQVTVSISQRDCGGVCDCGDPEAWVNKFWCKHMEPKPDSDAQIPKELYDAIKNTVDIAVDYTIDVLCSANTAVQRYKYAGQITDNEQQSRLSHVRYGVPDVETNGKYTHCMWNDQKHSFQDASNAIFHGTGKSARFAQMVTQEIDSNGRAVVYVSRDLQEMMKRKTIMEQTGLINTIRSSRDFFREEMCATIFTWLDDMSKSAIQGNFSVLRDIICVSFVEPWRFGTETLCEQLWTMEPRERDVPLMDYKSQLHGPYLPGIGEDDDDEQDILQPNISDMEEDEDPYREEQIADLRDSPSLPANGRPRTTSVSRSLEYISEDEGIFEEEQGRTPHLKLKPSEVSQYWRDEIMSPRVQQIAARVQYLIFFDIRLWKSVRLTLRDLYITVLVSNPDYKLQLGHLYAQIYPQIAELYMLADREPECSIINNLSTQLFTTPTIATDLARYDYFTRFMAALFTFFTTGEVEGPEYVNVSEGIYMEARVLSNRRFGQLFHDMEYMLNRNTEKQLISGNPNRIMEVADFALLFQGVSPVLRQKNVHVEYESENWIYIFNAAPYVLQLCQVVATGLTACSAETGSESIRLIADVIRKWAFGYYFQRYSGTEITAGLPPCLKPTKLAFGKVIERDIISFETEESAISFHHPVHVYLSWLIQSTKFNSSEDLRSSLIASEKERSEIFLNFDEETTLAVLLDHPLRVLGLLSQIQVGSWVRNGYSIRSQLHHYKEITLRDSAFSRDVFCAQTSLVVREPESAFMTLLSRWSLASWESAKELFDESQIMYMVEEFLHHLISFIMERTHLMGLSDTECKKRYITKEIIQCLGMHNMAFSEMCKHIPDTLTSDEMFEGILKTVANFKPPQQIRDVGMYELKPEYYHQFDTHYIHFNSAKIEEAETTIKTKIHKLHGKPIKEIVHEPPLQPLTSGPFIRIAQFTRTQSFARFCYDLLRLILNKETRSLYENNLGNLLHLFHIAIIDNLESDYESDLPLFVDQMCQVPLPDGSDDLQGHCILSILCEILKIDGFSERHARIKRIIQLLRSQNKQMVDDTLCKHSSQLVSDFTMDDNTDSETEAIRKKKLAEEKRKKVLQDFQRQQQLFAANNFADDMDDDEEMADEDAEARQNEWAYPESQCILCRMPDEEGYLYGLMGYVTESNVFRDIPFEDADWVYEAFASNSNLDEEIKPEDNDHGSPGWEHYRKEFHETYKIGPGFPRSSSKIRPVVTGCGHGIHYHCFEDYVQMTKNRGQQLTRNNPEDPSKGEFLCPLCKSLNNIFLPVVWKSNSRNLTVFRSINQEFGSFLGTLQQIEAMDDTSKERLIYLSNGIIASANNHLMPKFANAFNVQDQVQSNSLNLVLSALCNSLRSIALKVVGDYSMTKMVDTETVSAFLDCFASSLSSLEISLRGKKLENPFGGLLLDQIPNQFLQTMRVQGELCKSLLAVIRTSVPLMSKNVHGAQVFSRVYLEGLLEPSGLRASPNCFDDLVKSILVACPTYEIEPNHYLRKFYINEICNILVTVVNEVWKGSQWVTNPTLFELPCLEGYDDETLQALNLVVGSIRASVEERTTPHTYIWNKPAFIKVVYSILVKSLLPFLRKSTIFVHALCGVGYDPEDYMALEVDTEGDKLCQFLSLPPLNEILKKVADQRSIERRLVQSWCEGDFVKYGKSGNHSIEYPGVVRLLRLPHRLDEFFNFENHNHFGGELPPDPAVCLFCGESVGMQIPFFFSTYSKGQCYNHVQKCGKNCGIFLLPKRSSIILLRGGQGSFMEGPYLDIHGESDEVMK